MLPLEVTPCSSTPSEQISPFKFVKTLSVILQFGLDIRYWELTELYYVNLYDPLPGKKSISKTEIRAGHDSLQ